MSVFNKLICIGVISSLLCSSLALAGDEKERIINGPRGFDNRVLSSVIAIQTRGSDDDLVCLKGRLTNYIGKKSYEFTDLDGNCIEVELDDKRNWNLVHKNQLIEIFGEVERNMFVLAIKAKDFNILEEPMYKSLYNTPKDITPTRQENIDNKSEDNSTLSNSQENKNDEKAASQLENDSQSASNTNELTSSKKDS